MNFKERMRFLMTLQTEKKLPSFATVEVFKHCTGISQLEDYWNSVVNKLARGVWLKAPGSHYIPGESTSFKLYRNLLTEKVKVLGTDYPKGFSCETYLKRK
jgi:hypothetical protein